MTRRSCYVGVSTKAYLGHAQTLAWLDDVAALVSARPRLAECGIVPFVLPSFPLLPAALSALRGTGVRVGAQDVAWGDGPLTGEVPAAMLAEMGASIAMIGHAERRSLFGETDAIIARKHRAASVAGLTTLLCVGENSRSQATDAAEHCFSQVAAILDDTTASIRGATTPPPLLIAYEPVWAIGAERPAEPDYVNEVVGALRDRLDREHQGRTAGILYGGSAGPGLIDRLDGVDGLFLGRFAHDAGAFAQVLDEAAARAA
jgi:triosephosphate isomerase